MTVHQSEPPLEPVTTRIGGGISARAVALGAVAVLTVVVWLGMSGRSNQPPAVADVQPPTSTPPTSAPSIAAATPTPTLDSQSLPDFLPQSRPAVGRYVLGGRVGGARFKIELVEQEPGRLTGQYWPVSPPAGNRLVVRLLEVAPAGDEEATRVGRWRLGLDELAGDHRSGEGPFTISVPPRPAMLGAQLARQRGYELRVSVRLAFNEVAVIDFDLALGSGRRVVGDDGVMGGLTLTR